MKKLADAVLSDVETLSNPVVVDEIYAKKRKIRDLLGGGGVRDLRAIIDLGAKLADAMLDAGNEAHPTPETNEDQERVRAAKHFLKAAMGRLRGVKEQVYADVTVPVPDNGTSDEIDNDSEG